MAGKRQANNKLGISSSWDSLDGKGQEHVVSCLDPRGCIAMRATAVHCRQLVNQAVKSVSISRIYAGPARTVRLPIRFPNLQKLTLSDSNFGTLPFMETDFYHMFGGGQRFGKLHYLDINKCAKVDVLVLYNIIRAAPNLQYLATKLPYSPKAPTAATHAIAQLSSLQALQLFLNVRDDPGACLAVELSPLTALQCLTSVFLENVGQHVMAAIGKLTNLTSLMIDNLLHDPGDELEHLAALTNLQELKLMYGTLNVALLCDVLCQLASLRTFYAKDLLSSDDIITTTMPAVTAATQLTSLQLNMYASDNTEADDLCATFEGCLRMPGLQVLHVRWLEFRLDSGVLSVPAACSSSLRSLHVAVRRPETAILLLSSTAFRSLKLTDLELEFGFCLELDDDDADEFPAVLVQALCSQTSLCSLHLRTEDPIVMPADLWLQVGKHCQQIRHLKLSGSSLPLQGLADMPSLESLALIWLGGLEDVDMVHVFPCNKLHTVEFQLCSEITANAVAALAAAMPMLKQVQVHGCCQVKWDDELLPRPDVQVCVS